MKIMKKVIRLIDLELTDEQLVAFDIVSEVVTNLCSMLPGHMQGLENNENQYQISLSDLRLTADTLGNLAGASSFTILEDEGDD